jgi:hypothetical protein
VDFALRADLAGAAGPVARLEVVAQNGGRVLAQRELSAVDFAASVCYRQFAVAFESDVELADCEFRVVALGAVPVCADYVELVSEP